MPNKKNRVYSLADGIVLAIGKNGTSLVDLKHDNELTVELRYLAAIEDVALGSSLVGFEEHIPLLIRKGFLVEGQARCDRFLLNRLRMLDSMYLRAYAHRLTQREQQAYEHVLTAHAFRKRLFEQVGQCPAFPESVLRRALLVGDAQQVGVKKVLCLGDDDLMSIALASLGHEVTVFDIDTHLLKLIEHISHKLDLDIHVVEHDLLAPVKQYNTTQFDCFLTDPMDNRECFELFLSRALVMLKPQGTGYAAVFPPTYRMFDAVIKEMKCNIVKRFARHNHYYSRYVGQHHYESDWVAFKKTPETCVTIAQHSPAPLMHLYREDFFQRASNMLVCIDNIEAPNLAQPLYLNMILDDFEQHKEVTFLKRLYHYEQDRTTIHCPMPHGYLTLVVHRKTRRIMFDLFPFVPDTEKTLRELLMAAYKTNVKGSRLSVTQVVWDVRVD